MLKCSRLKVWDPEFVIFCVCVPVAAALIACMLLIMSFHSFINGAVNLGRCVKLLLL